MPTSTEEDKKNLLRRLKKIEGQVKGIERMIGDEKCCVDILTQIAAARAALHKVGMLIYENHTKGCLKEALKSDRQDEVLEELGTVLWKFTK